jgi:hypothetical protein
MDAVGAARRAALARTEKSCGPGHPVPVSTVASRLGTPGRARRKPLKPFACGNAGFLRCDRGDYARVVLSHSPREAAGASCARHSPRPYRAEGFAKPGRNRAAGRLSVVIARSDSDEAIHLSALPHYGLLRGACHRARIRATRWLAMTVSNLASSRTSEARSGTHSHRCQCCAKPEQHPI